ncbi:MAG: DUF2490 domain-containing protein [Salinivirgaceae bacterium]|nr:DUF2490 domain-containing protein [Salinivirgaceae bacterium]
MNKHLFFLILVTGVALPFFSTSQIKDFQSWNSLSVEWGLTKKVSLWAEQEFRFEENASMLGSFNTVCGVQYKINSLIRVSGAYRYSYNHDNKDIIEQDHRFYADIMIRYKLDRFTASYRPRYQMVFQQPTKDPFSHYNPQHIRHKLAVKYNIPNTPLTPFVDCELYESLNNPVKNTIEKTRYTAGVGYPINKIVTLEVYYRLEHRSDYIHKDRVSNILGFSCNLEF